MVIFFMSLLLKLGHAFMAGQSRLLPDHRLDSPIVQNGNHARGQGLSSDRRDCGLIDRFAHGGYSSSVIGASGKLLPMAHNNAKIRRAKQAALKMFQKP
jgi:hypothetical protein